MFKYYDKHNFIKSEICTYFITSKLINNAGKVNVAPLGYSVVLQGCEEFWFHFGRLTCNGNKAEITRNGASRDAISEVKLKIFPRKFRRKRAADVSSVRDFSFGERTPELGWS